MPLVEPSEEPPAVRYPARPAEAGLNPPAVFTAHSNLLTNARSQGQHRLQCESRTALLTSAVRGVPNSKFLAKPLLAPLSQVYKEDDFHKPCLFRGNLPKESFGLVFVSVILPRDPSTKSTIDAEDLRERSRPPRLGQGPQGQRPRPEGLHPCFPLPGPVPPKLSSLSARF